MSNKTNNIIKELAELPSRALEKTVDETARVLEVINERKTLKGLRRFWNILGPGLITGAADDDPSGIGTYSQAGSQFGLGALWLSLYSFPFMAVIQEICARIAMMTGKGLMANVKDRFPRWIVTTTVIGLAIANIFNIGVDLGAMAASTRLLLPAISFNALVFFFAVLSIVLQIYLPYKTYTRYLKWLALVVIAYIFSAASLHLPWITVLRHTIIPSSISFSSETIIMITAILGTTISPYLFFWETGQEIEEEIAHGRRTISKRRGATHTEIKRMRIDVWSGMFLSNLVMFFIIATCWATLNRNGITTIQTAAQAAEALRPFAGSFAYLLFTVGIIGTGILAIPTLAGSVAYAVSECFGWKEGLYRTLKQGRAFYGVIIISMMIGLAMNFIGIDPIKALVAAAVVNGIIAPIMLALVMRLSDDPTVMGPWKNNHLTSLLGWIITMIMSVASIATIIFLYSGRL